MASEEKGIVVGIDLGTTYSAVAYLNAAGKPEILMNAEGEMTTPSVVYFETSEKMVIGREAKNVADVYPDRIVAFAKQHIGRNLKEEGGKNHTWEIDGIVYRAEQVSAAVLGKLVQDASTAAKLPVTGAVITVPAIFGEAERTATKQAAELAGIPLLGLLNEPEAAALHYGHSHAEGAGSKLIMVVDLGGGTFDLTLMRVEVGESRLIEVLHTDGNRNLGGKLWDDRLIAYVCQQFEAAYGVDPRVDLDASQRIRLDAERVKQSLSSKEKAVFTVNHGERLRLEISRELFETLTADELETIKGWIKIFLADIVKKKHVASPKDIDKVLLVGGSTKMPQIQRLVEEMVGAKPESFEPDLAVAKGAAIYAVAKLAGDEHRSERNVADGARRGVSEDLLQLVAKTVVSTVSTFGLGTQTRGDNPAGKAVAGFYLINDLLIPRNTALPFTEKRTYYLTHDGQTLVRITMFEGEEINPDYCSVLGEGFLKDIPATSRAGDPVEIQASLTTDGTVAVTARYLKTGQEVSFSLVREVGIKDSDMVAMKQQMGRTTLE